MSCPNCSQESCSGCQDKFCTSDINCIQSKFVNLQIPAGATLTEVLQILEQYITESVSGLENISITLGADAECIGLTAGTYSYVQVFNAIISTICDILAVDPLNTDTMLLGPSITLPSCLSGFSGTTTTDLFEYISNLLCTIYGKLIFSGGPYSGSNTGVDQIVPIAVIRDVLKGIVDNSSYLSEQNNPVTDPNILSIEVNPMTGVVDYYPVKRTDSEIFTFTPNRDVYLVLDRKGVITKNELANGSPTPSYPNDLMLYKIVTDGKGITSLNNLFDTSGIDPTPLSIPDNYIIEQMIAAGAVTQAKMATSGVTAGTYGIPQLFSFTVSNKGVVTAATTNVTLTGLADGDVLAYVAANGRFENKVPMTPGTVDYIPKSTGTGLTSSSMYEDVDQIYAGTKMEVSSQSAAPDNDPDAAFNVVGGPLKLYPMSATDASALPLVDGYMVYVNTTNVTFTSVGFWGVENGAWVKL